MFSVWLSLVRIQSTSDLNMFSLKAYFQTVLIGIGIIVV
jgi:hypothetical protein